MRKPSPSSLLAVAALSLAACNDPPTPTTVRARIASDLGYVLAQTNAASAGATIPSTSALAMLANVVPSTGASASRGGQVLTKLLTALAPRPVAKRARLAAGDRIDAQAAIDYLDNTIFTDASSLGNGLYQVPASVVCTTTTYDTNGTETTSLDADCAAKFAQADVRIRVEEDGDALRFAIQLDADHDEPVTVSLAHDALGLTVDLDSAGKAITALAMIYAEQPPNLRLAGQVTAELQILGTAHAKASLHIDRDLAIAVADQGQALDGAQAFQLTSVRADVLAVELDGGAGTGALDLALGATKVQAPTDTDPLVLDLPGATADAAFTTNGPVALTGIGLGDRALTVSRGGQRGFALDLNPDNGRTLDATLATDGTFTVTPKLDLHLAVDHAVLGDTAGPYDVMQVLLTGAVRPTPSGNLQVVSGTFAVVTNPAAYGIVASAGQCIADTEVSDTTSDTYYDQWMTTTCD